jgi:hypothetical protein
MSTKTTNTTERYFIDNTTVTKSPTSNKQKRSARRVAWFLRNSATKNICFKKPKTKLFDKMKTHFAVACIFAF